MSAYMPQSKTDNWASPPHIIEQVIEEFGKIGLDPAASKSNAVAKRFFDESMNGLEQGWVANLVYVNPPYGRILNEWVKKALHEFDSGRSSGSLCFCHPEPAHAGSICSMSVQTLIFDSSRVG